MLRHDIAYSHNNDFAEHMADNILTEKTHYRVIQFSERERESRSHSSLGNYEDQSEEWWVWKQGRRMQADISDSETWRSPTYSNAARHFSGHWRGGNCEGSKQ